MKLEMRSKAQEQSFEEQHPDLERAYKAAQKYGSAEYYVEKEKREPEFAADIDESFSGTMGELSSFIARQRIMYRHHAHSGPFLAVGALHDLYSSLSHAHARIHMAHHGGFFHPLIQEPILRYIDGLKSYARLHAHAVQPCMGYPAYTSMEPGEGAVFGLLAVPHSITRAIRFRDARSALVSGHDERVFESMVRVLSENGEYAQHATLTALPHIEAMRQMAKSETESLLALLSDYGGNYTEGLIPAGVKRPTIITPGLPEFSQDEVQFLRSLKG